MNELGFEELVAEAMRRLTEDRQQIKGHLAGVDPEQASFLHTCLVKNTALVIELARLKLRQDAGTDSADELKKQAGDIYNQIGESFSGHGKDEDQGN